ARGDAARGLLPVEEPRGRGLRDLPVAGLRRGERAALLRLPALCGRDARRGEARQGVDPRRVPEGDGRRVSGASGGGTTAPAPLEENPMPRPNPTRPYNVHGFRVALVREPGVKLAERPSLKTPAEAAFVLAEYVGERDREVFVIALLTIRHRLIGVHTVSVGCLASSLVHPAMVMKPAILAS